MSKALTLPISLESLFLLFFLWSRTLKIRPGILGDELFLFILLPVVLVGGYVLVDCFFRAHRYAAIFRWSMLGAIALFLFILPYLTMMQIRADAGSFNLHDGALQTEIALNFLRQGKNPYIESYRGTDLTKWNTGYVGFMLQPVPIENPALDYYVYPPGYLAVSYPFFFISEELFGWYDQRIVLLFFLFVFAALFLKIVPRANRELAFILLLFHPQFYETFLFAFNDVVMLAILTGALALLKFKRWRWASVVLGVAVGVKHSAVFLTVPLLLYLFLCVSQGVASRREKIHASLTALLPFFAVVTVIYIPVWIITGSAFPDSIFRYASGSIQNSYPITGFGFSQLLVIVGAVDWRASFPFWIPQLIVLVPTAVFFFHQMKKNQKLSLAILFSGMWFGLAAFFSRFLNINYLAVVVSMCILAFLLEPRPAIGEERPS